MDVQWYELDDIADNVLGDVMKSVGDAVAEAQDSAE